MPFYQASLNAYAGPTDSGFAATAARLSADTREFFR
jgi:hypothetical protein